MKMFSLLLPGWLLCAVLLLGASAARAAVPEPFSLWQFDADTLANGIASGGALTATAFTPAYAEDSIGTHPARVLSVPSLSSSSQRLVIPATGGANGGSASFVNNWSVVMDVKIPALPAFTALLQTNTANSNDADVHLTGAGDFYFGGVANAVSPTAHVAAGVWTRLAITCGNSSSGGPLTVRGFINGVKVFENTAQAFDGTYALDPTALLFADNNAETAALLCNSIGYWRVTLTAADIGLLGGPSAGGLTRFLVENTNASGTGSLDGAINAATSAAGADSIGFASTLNGQTLTLTGQSLITDTSGVTIDATALPGGFTLDANNASRHFQVQAGKSLTLRGLTLTRGNGTGNGETVGGSILSDGTLTLSRCTLTENASPSAGGAIYSEGTLRAGDCTISENTAAATGGGIQLNAGTADLSRCTLSGNTADDGGALSQNGMATLSHCTVSGNHSTNFNSTGGITSFSGNLTLQHCTVAQNTGKGGGGGGVYLESPATVSIAFSLIAGNTDPGGPADIYKNGGTLNVIGASLIGSNQSVETQFPTGPLVGTASTPLDPKLTPLGYFGGPTQTMHPLIGSPAIDAGGSTDPGGTDQRGFPRFVDGDANFSPQLDLGAVEAGPLLTVTTGVDENNGPASGAGTSLREALTISTSAGARLRFSTSQFPGTITLTLGELAITQANGLFLDASNLTGPVTISGNNQSRVFNIAAGATVAMHSLKITNGRTANGTVFNPGSDGGAGGGISSGGSLSLLSCSIVGNVTGSGGSDGHGGHGGGVYSSGPLILVSCSLTGNQTSSGGDGGGHGGGLRCEARSVIRSSTFSGNGADTGGGVSSSGSAGLLLDQTTIAGNAGVRRGGGIAANLFTLRNSIVAANSDSFGSPDIVLAAVTYQGANFVGNTSGINSATGPAPLTGAALLAPLGDYGGPTQTMALKPGSPARDAGGPMPEVQQVNIGAIPGNFTLTFNGATTATLNFASTAAQVQNALAALSNIGAGNVAVSLSTDANNRRIYTVSFLSALAGVNVSPLTGSGDIGVAVTTLQDGFTATVTRDQRGFPIVGPPDLGAYEAGTLTNYNAFIYETLPATASDAQHASTFDFDGDGANNLAEFLAGTVVTTPASIFRITGITRSGLTKTVTFPTVIGRHYQFESSPDLVSWAIGPGLVGDGTPKDFSISVGGSPLFLRIRVGP